MALSIYEASVPAMLRGLATLKHLLKKGEAHAEAKKVDPSALLNARLALDMHPLTRQVQMVSDSSKGAAARLAGVEPPSMPDTEATFADLCARIDRTADFIKSLKPEQFDGPDDRTIVMKTPNAEFKFTAADYIRDFALPNIHFHTVTAYNILRHNGVDVGKMDFLGGGR